MFWQQYCCCLYQSKHEGKENTEDIMIQSRTIQVVLGKGLLVLTSNYSYLVVKP